MAVAPVPDSLTVAETIALFRKHAFTIPEPYDGAGRKIVHCFIGFVGADWNLDEAVAFAERAELRMWIDSVFNHDLAILADGRWHTFNVPRPRD